MTPEMKKLENLMETIRLLIRKDKDVTLVVKYLDDENEWITIDRDIEFETALEIAEDVLRLQVTEEVVAESECPVWKGRGRGGKRGSWKGKGKRGCGRGRKQLRSETADNADCEATLSNSDETASEPVWHKYKNKGKGKGKGARKCNGNWKKGKKFFDETTSESVDPTLTVEELKAQIQKLVESQEVVRGNLKEANEKMGAKKSEIVELRKNPNATGEEIAALRSELVELKTAKLAVRSSLWSTKREICQLRQAIRAKRNQTSETPSEE